jgi:hypothetical protein
MTDMASPYRRKRESTDVLLAISEGARKLARWGHIFYWSGVTFAIPILSMAIIFALLDREPIFQRVASVLVLGVIPALLIWGSGFIICNMLRAASALYNPTATALRRVISSLDFT